jgi:hypothetical protein
MEVKMENSNQAENDRNQESITNEMEEYTENNERYHSAELMLSVIQKEYDYETVRKTALETRSGILMTLGSVILTFAVSKFNVSDINFPIEEKSILVYYCLYFLFMFFSVGSILFSLFNLIKVLFATEYRRLDISDFTSDLGEYQKDVLAMGITIKYREIIDYNHQMNDKKVASYRRGVYSLIIAIFSTVILYGLTINF